MCIGIFIPVKKEQLEVANSAENQPNSGTIWVNLQGKLFRYKIAYWQGCQMLPSQCLLRATQKQQRIFI